MGRGWGAGGGVGCLSGMVNDGWLFEWLIRSCFARQWDVGGGALVEEQAGLDMNTDKNRSKLLVLTQHNMLTP